MSHAALGEKSGNNDLREGKLISSISRHFERRIEAEQVQVPIPKPPHQPPTTAEMIEIKAKVQEVIVSASDISADHHTAATKIAASFRGKRARRSYRLQSSALKIQSVWRGVIPRRVKEAALIRLKLENTVATQIQSARRMVLARRVLVQFRAARMIQAAWRRVLPRTRFSELHC